MDDDNEVLDLVDKNDKVVGKILRSQIGRTDLVGFVRAAEVLIQNSNGQLWIPRRQAHKKIAPGGLDYSMGEHVQAGEDYLQACVRGLKEELNLNVSKNDLKPVKKFAPEANLGYFRYLYLYKTDKSPKYNPNDFSEASWLMPKELLAKLESGRPAKLSLLETITYLIDTTAG